MFFLHFNHTILSSLFYFFFIVDLTHSAVVVDDEEADGGLCESCPGPPRNVGFQFTFGKPAAGRFSAAGSSFAAACSDGRLCGCSTAMSAKKDDDVDRIALEEALGNSLATDLKNGPRTDYSSGSGLDSGHTYKPSDEVWLTVHCIVLQLSIFLIDLYLFSGG